MYLTKLIGTAVLTQQEPKEHMKVRGRGNDGLATVNVFNQTKLNPWVQITPPSFSLGPLKLNIQSHT